MSLRLRLGLWYGGLTGLVVLLVSIFTYAAHTRGHYDDQDYTLQTTAVHMAQEYESGESLLAPPPETSVEPPGAPVVISQSLAVWIYDAYGRLVARSPGTREAPTIDPLAVMAHPSPPPFDPIAGLAPPLMGIGNRAGAFGLSKAAGGERWRYYVLPFHKGNHFLVVGSSLARVDESVAQLRWLAIIVTLAGAAVTLLAGWLLAGRALRPVATVTETASAIAHSRALDRRVPLTSDHDELGKLAATFNEMLGSLEQAYRAQQRFVSDASHELRAPLTAIQGNLDLLERIPNMPPEDRQEAISEASREARRLARLVADLLALARADAGVGTRREPVEVDRVLMQAFSEARHLARGQEMQVAGLEPAIVQGDPDRLKQLFIVLLDNALKYTPPSGRVSVSMDVVDSRAEVRVKDSGIGIPAEDLPHIFERFYRADPARGRDPGGTGLGLSIARWIVEQHHGEISLESEPGRGTTAVVQLPAAPQPKQ